MNGGYKEPLAQGRGMGRNYHHLRRWQHYLLQPECWLLRLSLLLYFLSNMELLGIKKKEILGGLGRKHVAKSQELADI